MAIVFNYEYPAGRTRQGTYTIFGEHATIEVITEFGKRAARVEESRPEVLARRIARELAKEAAVKANADLR
jgi:hypothetical protein